MGDFGSKYSKIRPYKDRGHDPTTKKILNSQQEKRYTINHVADEIILKENIKTSAESEAQVNIDYEID